MPLLVRWPGKVKAGSRCGRLVGLNDLAATLADILDVDLGDNAPDSISFLPLLANPEADPTRGNLVMQSPLAFVVRDGKWKLALTPSSGSRGLWGAKPVPEEAWGKALRAFGGKPTDADLRRAPFVQLFDLEADIGEAKNLAAAQPEIVARISSLLNEQIARGRSTPGPQLQNDVRKVAVHRNAQPWIER